MASFFPSVAVWCQIHRPMLWMGLYYFIHCTILSYICRIKIRTRNLCQAPPLEYVCNSTCKQKWCCCRLYPQEPVGIYFEVLSSSPWYAGLLRFYYEEENFDVANCLFKIEAWILSRNTDSWESKWRMNHEEKGLKQPSQTWRIFGHMWNFKSQYSSHWISRYFPIIYRPLEPSNIECF